MRVINRLEKFGFRNPVATIGVFDGVHIGHQKILDAVKTHAKKINGESVVITLWPHPRFVIQRDQGELNLLNTLEEKKILLEKAGIDNLVIIPFTKQIAAMTSEAFIRNVLIDKIGVKQLILGHDHHFGKQRDGNYKSLVELSKKYNFNIDKIEAVFHHEQKISSTIIRNHLFSGQVSRANELLGYHYFIEAIVGHGNRIGREIGFPTANATIINPYKIIPKDGVYAAFVKWKNKLYKAMLNVGFRPTIDEEMKRKVVEVHIMDFYKNIYNERLVILFVDRLRDEVKFDGLNKLKNQLNKDKTDALAILDTIPGNDLNSIM